MVNIFIGGHTLLSQSLLTCKSMFTSKLHYIHIAEAPSRSYKAKYNFHVNLPPKVTPLEFRTVKILGEVVVLIDLTSYYLLDRTALILLGNIMRDSDRVLKVVLLYQNYNYSNLSSGIALSKTRVLNYNLESVFKLIPHRLCVFMPYMTLMPLNFNNEATIKNIQVITHHLDSAEDFGDTLWLFSYVPELAKYLSKLMHVTTKPTESYYNSFIPLKELKHLLRGLPRNFKDMPSELPSEEVVLEGLRHNLTVKERINLNTHFEIASKFNLITFLKTAL